MAGIVLFPVHKKGTNGIFKHGSKILAESRIKRKLFAFREQFRLYANYSLFASEFGFLHNIRFSRAISAFCNLFAVREQIRLLANTVGQRMPNYPTLGIRQAFFEGF
jgi:hypothetical protein